MLTTWLTIVEIVYVIALSVWIILEKRPPLATLAWVLGLAALPLVGFAVYWFIGPRHIRRKRSRHARVFRRIRASLPDLRLLGESAMLGGALDPRKRQLMALALNSAAAPLTAGNSLRVLRNGSECFPAIEEAVLEAKHHVHLEYYIFNDDRTGARMRDLLIEKAKARVHVRLLVDAVGSVQTPMRFFHPLRDAGGEVGLFNVISFPRVRPVYNFRNHRKIVVCDAKVGFLGGLNVSDADAGIDPQTGPWRDTHLRVAGPAVRGLQLLFLEDWNFATRRSVTDPPYFTRTGPIGDEVVQIIGSGPDGDWQAMQQVFFTVIASAQDRVLLSTPYLIPDESLLTALTAAALRGVDVKLLVPRRGDSRIVSAAARSYYDELIRAGVRVYEYLAGFLHAKTLVVDRTLSLVGSANLDQRSLRLNFEVGAICYGESVALELEAIFEQDLTLAHEVTAELRRETRFADKLGEASARLLTPLL